VRQKKYMHRFFSLIVLVMCSFWLVSCGNKDSQTLMKVNEDLVGINEVKFYLTQIQTDFERQGGKDIWETDFGGKTAEEVAKERTLDSIIWLKILKSKAVDMGLTLTEDEENRIETQAEQMLEQMDKQDVQQFGLSKKMLGSMIRESVLSERVFNEVTKDFTPEEVAAEQFYQDFYGEDKDPLLKVRVRHILLQTHELDETFNWKPLPEEKQKEALQKAEEALAKARKGEDFISLVSEYSEDPGSKDQGGEYTFTKYDGLEPSFVETAFGLQPGEISELVHTSYGYHIIKLEEKIEPTAEEIDEDKQHIKDYYKEVKKQEIFQEQYEEWKKQANIEINEELWGQVHIDK